MELLKDKTALITGSSRGIGLAVARQFVANGAKVIVTSEQSPDDALRDIAENTVVDQLYNKEIAALRELLSGGRAHYIQANMRNDAEIEALIAKGWETLRTVDILVNNVGIFSEPALLEMKWADFERVFRTNVWSHIKTTQEFVRRRMAENKGGRLLFTTSINAKRSEPDHTLYDASKAAVSALVGQFALQWAKSGFTTMGIAAGLHATHATGYGLITEPENRRIIDEQIPLGIGTVDDVAYWHLVGASDGARYATGTIVEVDGGITPMQMPTRPIAESERH